MHAILYKIIIFVAKGKIFSRMGERSLVQMKNKDK